MIRAPLYFGDRLCSTAPPRGLKKSRIAPYERSAMITSAGPGHSAVCLLCRLSDRSDGSPAGGRLRRLLDASSHHRDVGGVWEVPPERRLLCLPHRLPLSVVRKLLREPRPLRVPV